MEEEPIPHRRIAVDTFNGTWELIDEKDRTPEQAEEMIHMAHASAWHWRQVDDHTPGNLSVGAWQLSRVYALTGSPARARHYGQQSLDLARDNDLGPFFVGYGYEALARAEAAAGNNDLKHQHLEAARREAAAVESEDYRQPLLDDLATI